MTERVITVADAAITHLKELKSKQGVDHLWLRMGVRSGGCSVRAIGGGCRFRWLSIFQLLNHRSPTLTFHTPPPLRQGMSYVLDVMKPEEITAEDHVEKYAEHGFSCVVDPQSMLYLFGLQLDYKDALIGGGFQFMVRGWGGWVHGCGREGASLGSRRHLV